MRNVDLRYFLKSETSEEMRKSSLQIKFSVLILVKVVQDYKISNSYIFH